MRKNDQYFKPGDKVMRVGGKPEEGSVKNPNGFPKFGTVYCVEDFYQGPQFNAVMLVGFGGFLKDCLGRPIGWRAIHFRKVDEIKLCVAAVNHSQKEIKQPYEC